VITSKEEARRQLAEAEERSELKSEEWKKRVQRRKLKYLEREEALKRELAKQKTTFEEELNDKIQREEDWARKVGEYQNKYEICVHALNDANEAAEKQERELSSEITSLQGILTESSEQLQAAAEREARLQEMVGNLEKELARLHQGAARKEEEWGQRMQLLSQNLINQDDEMQKLSAFYETRFSQESKEKEALANTLAATERRVEDGLAKQKQLESQIAALERELKVQEVQTRELMGANTHLEMMIKEEQSTRANLELALRSAEDGTDNLHAKLDTEVKRNKELQQSLSATTAQKNDLTEKLAAERANTNAVIQELQLLKESYNMEKSLRDKIAQELFSEIDARKEGEKRQASIISALNEHMKKQAEAIVQLDFALKQEQADRAELESQLEEAVLARAKAEEALRKLDEIFKHAPKDEDGEWELVSEKGQ